MTQHVTAQAELTVYTVRTTGQAATVAQTRSAGITWLLLQGDNGSETLFRRGVQVDDGRFQLGTLFWRTWLP
ncbi:hypothetical protein PPS11_06890 [Pseudomonas putida S11]|nr:hypothetical protein PPS11_06890 [Pseudomonas putida S11]